MIKDLLDAVNRLDVKKYNPAEARAPKGTHEGGRFVSSGAAVHAVERAVKPKGAEKAPVGVPGGSSGDGYGVTRARMIARGDDVDVQMKANGKYENGDPRNDPEYAKYTEEVDAKIEAAIKAGQESSQRFAKRDSAGNIIKDGSGDQVYTAERTAQHLAIINKIMADSADVPSDRQAIMLGGLPGAGKSTFLQRLGAGLGGFLKVNEKGHPTNAIIINPDEMKSLLLNTKGMVPRTSGLTDGEHASLVHEESSHLAKMLAERAMSEGKNVVFDITLGNADKAAKKYLKNPEKKGALDIGYKVHAVFIDGDMATSLHRAGLRHKAIPKGGSQRTMAGRYVKYDHIRGEANKTGALDAQGRLAKSQNRVEYDKLVKQGVFTSATRHDNATSKTHDDIPLPKTSSGLEGIPAGELDTTELAQFAEMARRMAASGQARPDIKDHLDTLEQAQMRAMEALAKKR